MFGAFLDRVRETGPLIHCITNYVTANDTANMLLACGASPVMADDPGEAAEISSISAALCLNIGTLHQGTLPAMLAAGEAANSLGHPVVLDPVGAGASRARTESALKIVSSVHPGIIRGNMTEIRALTGAQIHSRGVDADAADAVDEGSLDASVRFLKACALQLGAVVAATGAVDLVTDGKTCFVLRGGRPEMGRVTGTGCQLSAMTAAFAAASPDRLLEAAAAAIAAMDAAGETAWDRMAPGDGNATYRNRIIDAVYCMTGPKLDRKARFEILS